MTDKIVESKLKCPKCKSNHLELIEVWTSHTIVWYQEDGKFNRNDGNLDPREPNHVEANCRSCAHKWKPKNCPQIDYVIKEINT